MPLKKLPKIVKSPKKVYTTPAAKPYENFSSKKTPVNRGSKRETVAEFSAAATPKFRRFEIKNKLEFKKFSETQKFVTLRTQRKGLKSDEIGAAILEIKKKTFRGEKTKKRKLN